ncbi:MAG: AAA family ATPase [Muribaculaceae bacterium]|nr:AAA family ATPase [Muribaculaceae bacterium]
MKEQHDIDLNNDEFQNAWKLINYTHQSVFLTGKAGTGKSTFLKYIRDNIKKKYVVLAPTGIAAVNVGGVTMHSFFRIPLKPLLPDDPDFAVKRLRERMKYPKDLRKLIKELELIIIDEISMVRADVIDFIDKILRVYSSNMREPFGGKQLLLVGDIFQLEPVVTSDMREVLCTHYQNSYFFSANAFSQIEIVPIELKKIYRQNDSQFISMLDRIRMGRPLQEDVLKLNQRVFERDSASTSDDKMVMTLATRRDMVDTINENRLKELSSKEMTYTGQITGDFPENSLPTTMELTIKVGAQVVFIKNDREKRWVNGSIGKIVKAKKNSIEIELESGAKYAVEKAVWENIVYKYDEKTNRVIENVIGTFEQYPIKLAWALTVHKSQGLTFNNVVIDIGRGAFSSGQTYVALSRCRSFEGMQLRSTVSERDIFVNPSIIEFSRQFNNQALINKALQHAYADDCYHEAAVAFDRGDMSVAVDKFIDGVKSRNELNNEVATRLLKYKLSRITRMEQQLEAYREIIASNAVKFQSLAKEYVQMGDYCVHEGMDYTPAIANYDKALSLDDKCVDAWYGKGLALMDSGEPADAINCFERAYAIDGNHFNAAFQLGNIYRREGDMALALDWYLIAQKCDNTNAPVLERIADVYESIGDDDQADQYRFKAEKLRKQRRSKK